MLPGDAVFPEGIAYDPRGGGTIYVTSTTDGTIFCGDPKDTTLAPCFPGGTGGITAFKAYVAQSRARTVTWTVVAEASVREAVKRGRALGDASPITAEHL